MSGRIYALIALIGWLTTVSLHAQVAQAQDQPPKVIPPKIEGGSLEVKLPCPVTNLCMGGNGRYILLHLDELQKIAVFDVNELKIAGYIPANDDVIEFAAGSTKAVVISGSKGVITRWNLQTLERELTQAIDVTGRVASVLMGWNTQGPIVATFGTERHDMKTMEIDLASLKATTIVFESNQPSRAINRNARISAGGETISVWESHVSPSGLQSCYRSGKKWMASYEHSSVGSIIPTADGRHLLSQGGIYTRDLQLVTPGNNFNGLRLLPAVNGPLILGVAVNDPMMDSRNATNSTLSKLFLMGDSRALATDISLDPIVIDRHSSNQTHSLPLEKRVIFIPDANLIVQIPATADQLKCISYDVDATLKNSKASYLVVTSNPLEQLAAGSSFDYQIEYKSSATQVKFNLESGPTGMKLSPEGKLSWTTSKESSPENNIIVSVTAQDGQETYHTFKLNVVGATGSDVPSLPRSDGTSPDAPKVESASFDGLQKEIKLPCPLGEMVVGGAGRFLLFHLPELRKIGVFDVTQAKLTGYIPASDDQTILTATKNKLLVASVTQGVISRWNLANLTKEMTVSAPFAGSIQSMAAGCAADGPAMVCWSQGNEQLSSTRISFLDVDTLQEIKAIWPNGNQPHAVHRDYNRVRAASNGQYFTFGSHGAMRIEGTRVTSSIGHGGGIMAPSADGKSYSMNGQIVNFERTQLTDKNSSFGFIVPSVTGNFFLSFPSVMAGSNTQQGGAKLYMFGDKRPLLTLPDLNFAVPNDNRHHQLALDADQRIAFIPDAKVIVMISATNDSLILHRFDVDEALEESGIDYLVVTSRPQSNLKLGDSFEYALQVKSKLGGLKYKLESGPTGMAVSSDGKVTWKVPADLTDPVTNSIVAVSDASGQEIFHTFSLEVPELRELAAKREADRLAQAQLESAKPLLDSLKAQRSKNQMARTQRLGGAESATKTATQNTPAKAAFRMRTWTDSTGTHKVEATFVRIIDKKTVVLTDASGNEKSIPLERLAVEDIYHAVECDLLRNNSLLFKADSLASPFEDARAKSPTIPTDADKARQKIVNDLDARITEMIGIVEKDDPETYLPKIFHPDQIAKIQAVPRSLPSRIQLLERLLRLNPDNISISEDTIQFLEFRANMQKHNGSWYLNN